MTEFVPFVTVAHAQVYSVRIEENGPPCQRTQVACPFRNPKKSRVRNSYELWSLAPVTVAQPRRLGISTDRHTNGRKKEREGEGG